MSDYHEPWEALPPDVRDAHRALTSLKEEIEAIDWYHQRVALCTDPELRQVLAHNRDEEIEHACMALEWLRRHMEGWDADLRTYLFTEASIAQAEQTEKAADAPTGVQATAEQRPLGIGSLKGR